MTRYLLLIFCFFTFSVAGQSQSNIDVLHYKFTIELNDDNDTIYGRADITVKFLESSNRLEFNLVQPDKKGKAMSIVNIIGPNAKNALADPGLRLCQIDLSKKTAVNDTATYTIIYKGIPEDGLIISKNKYGKRTFFADNWPDRGHNWIPCKEDPADKASVEFIVTAPQHYQVISNGIQIEETNLVDNKKRTHWREDVPISTKVMVIGVADFAVNLSGTINDCIPVYSWVYPEDRDKGFYDYAQAAEILPWFIKNVGPYAYKKLANVQSKTRFGGLENANTIFYSEHSVNGNRQSESLMVHEIAHQWFGNYATEKSFAHLWLSEGFATSMTILYMENKYGKDTAIAMRKEDREQVIDFGKRNALPVVNNTKDFMTLLNANSYQKGGWVLHMLRRELGDSIFWKSIQLYYSTYGGSVADTDDLRKVFEKVSGKDLKQFFQQWLFTAANPNLKINWNYNASSKKLNITTEQLQKGEAFQFPLEFGIYTEKGKPSLQKIAISKKSETFTLTLVTKPESIVADPNISLLFEATVSEIK
ncbi:MAG TPA: M1 family aminopeptidase [Chitinophagaceae bacterium]|nr:M1 family aminopeptidase [Chitinophagaceae bacterium]